MSDRWWQSLREPCPVPEGTRIRLVSMPDDPCPVDVGTTGTVQGGTGGQIWVRWDDGRGLALIPGIDRWEVID